MKILLRKFENSYIFRTFYASHIAQCASRPSTFSLGAALVASLVLIFFTTSFLINSASNQINTFYVSKVNGEPNFANPGAEAFWAGVPTITVPLIPSSNYPPSGQTQTVSVQIAWTATTATPATFGENEIFQLWQRSQLFFSRPVLRE